MLKTLQWRHNEHDGVSNHQPHNYLLNRLFRHRSKKTSKLCVTDLCEGNSPATGEFPAQRASNAENVPIWWRHHDIAYCDKCIFDIPRFLIALKDLRIDVFKTFWRFRYVLVPRCDSENYVRRGRVCEWLCLLNPGGVTFGSSAVKLSVHSCQLISPRSVSRSLSSTINTA